MFVAPVYIRQLEKCRSLVLYALPTRSVNLHLAGESVSTVNSSWSRIRAAIESAIPGVSAVLRPGVSATQLGSFEKMIGQRLPNDVRESYLLCDGTTAELEQRLLCGPFYGFDMLPLAELIDSWKMWAGLVEGKGHDAHMKGVDWIRPVYASSGWLPIIADAAGSHIGVDLSPTDKGLTGQVINFGRHEYSKLVLAPTFEAFLAQIAADLESQYIHLGLYEGKPSYNAGQFKHYLSGIHDPQDYVPRIVACFERQLGPKSAQIKKYLVALAEHYARQKKTDGEALANFYLQRMVSALN